MGVIYLIRHGQASFGKANYDDLSDTGYEQARRLGQVLADRIPAFDISVMGSMQRHKQTATTCLEQFQCHQEQGGQGLESLIQVNSDWNEYDHREILKRYRPEFETDASMIAFVKQQENPRQFMNESFNGAVDRWVSAKYDSDYFETWLEFKERVRSALRHTMELSMSGKTVAVFTSGGPISLVSHALLGVDEAKFMSLNWTLMNCGVTKILNSKSRVFVASLNEHTHFEGADNKHLITYT